MKQSFVEIGGERYELIEPASYDFDESRLAKQISGGMSLAQLEQKLAESDPDAWLAVAFVSMRRVDPRVTQQRVIAALRKQPLIAIVDSFEVVGEDDEQEVDPRPPARPAAPSGSPGSSDDES